MDDNQGCLEQDSLYPDLHHWMLPRTWQCLEARGRQKCWVQPAVVQESSQGSILEYSELAKVSARCL